MVHYKEIITTSTTNTATPIDNTPTLLLLHGFNGSVFNWCVEKKTKRNKTI